MVTAGKVMAMTFADLVASNAALSGEVRRSHEALKIAQLTIDKMKVELAYLRRMKYGRSSERLEHAQLELVGGQVASPMVELSADADPDDGLKSNVTSLDTERKKREPRTRPGCASCLRTCRDAPSFTPPKAHAAARPVALACGRLVKTSRRFWTTSRAPSTWCAMCARSWPARAAGRSRRRWRRPGRWTGAWPGRVCSRTSR
jgi:hypothetical protein